MKPPNGLDEMLAAFGDPHDPRFEVEHIVPFELPYPLVFNTAMIHRARAHTLVVPYFVQALQAIKDMGLVERATEYAGIYANRNIRGKLFPSTHSWGIAIDLNAETLPLGSPKHQHPGVVKAFKDAGFTYGGDFLSRRDPMHFQFASGY